MRIPRFGINGSILSGEVCTIHVVANMDYESEQEMWQFLADGKSQARLQSEMLAATHETLGPEFDVRGMSFRRGSIEFFVTIGAVYYAVSRYKNFVESIELLASQLSGVVRRFLGSFPSQSAQVAVSVSWQPGPGLVRLEAGGSTSRSADWAYPLLWYVIVSHAALLALLIWLLARRPVS